MPATSPNSDSSMDRSRSFPSELSRGMKQKLMVAMALVWVDEQYSDHEKEAIERLRDDLGVSQERSAELERWAREFVVDQLFDAIYADGVMDADYCVAIDEAENRLHVQKAVMALTMS